jgi:hypothetical protein
MKSQKMKSYASFAALDEWHLVKAYIASVSVSERCSAALAAVLVLVISAAVIGPLF